MSYWAGYWDKVKLLQAVVAEVGLSITALRPCPFTYELAIEGDKRYLYFHWPSVRRWWMESHAGERLPRIDNGKRHPRWVRRHVERKRTDGRAYPMYTSYWRIDLLGAEKAGLKVPFIPNDAFEIKQERRRRGPRPPPPAQRPFRDAGA